MNQSQFTELFVRLEMNELQLLQLKITAPNLTVLFQPFKYEKLLNLGVVFILCSRLHNKSNFEVLTFHVARSLKLFYDIICVIFEVNTTTLLYLVPLEKH